MLIADKSAYWPNSALRACLAGLPLFTMTVSGWASGILIVSWILAIWIALRGPRLESQLSDEGRQWLALIAVALALPFAGIFLGQVFRQEYSIRDFDSQARLLCSALILYVIVRQRLDVLRPLTLVVPGSLLIVWVVLMAGVGKRWDPTGERLSTFVDPLTFGSLCLTLGLFSFLSIDLFGRDRRLLRLYKLAGLVIGVYLSIRSGSRTGWLAAPLVLLLWLYVRTAGYRLLLVATLVGACVTLFFVSSTVRERTTLAYKEVSAYQWDAPNPLSSVGDRISFHRIAVFLATEKPLSGHGDHGFERYVGHPDLNRFAIRDTQEWALKHGFHNEVLTSMVRSGVWGLLAGLGVLLIPAVLFFRGLRFRTTETGRVALLAAGYWLCTMVTSMTTEVFNLKFTASFHALMLACLAKELIVRLPPHYERQQS